MNVTVFTAADRRHFGLCEADFHQSLAAALDELFPGMREHDAAWRADEKRRPKPVLQLADAAADRRFLNAQGCGSAPKAAVVCRCDHVLDVTDLYRQSTTLNSSLATINFLLESLKCTLDI